MTPPTSKVVSLKRRGDGAGRVLLLPGLGGSVLTLLTLGRAYPGPEAVVGLESPSPRSIPTLASNHLAEAANALGTDCRWHLAGCCLGATVALEMALQMERSGRRPGAVVLVEPFLRLGGELDGGERASAARRQDAVARLHAMLEQAGSGSLDAGPAVREDLRELDLDPGLLRFGEAFTLNVLTYIRLVLPAYLAHVARPIAAPVHLLLAEDDCCDAVAMERRLRELTGGVTVHRLPCPAAELLRQPRASAVAALIASLVAQTD